MEHASRRAIVNGIRGLVFAAVASQSSLVVADPIVVTAADKCGLDVYCKWTDDTKNFGQLLIFHPTPVSFHGADPEGPVISTSPNKFWQVTFVWTEIDAGTVLPGFTEAETHDSVALGLGAQHITKGDNMDVEATGAEYPAGLEISADGDLVDDEGDDAEHDPHEDAYAVKLFGIANPTNANEILNWGAWVAGRHPPSQRLEFPSDIVFVTEPSTVLVLGLGLVWVVCAATRRSTGSAHGDNSTPLI